MGEMQNAESFNDVDGAPSSRELLTANPPGRGVVAPRPQELIMDGRCHTGKDTPWAGMGGGETRVGYSRMNRATGWAEGMACFAAPRFSMRCGKVEGWKAFNCETTTASESTTSSMGSSPRWRTLPTMQ